MAPPAAGRPPPLPPNKNKGSAFMPPSPSPPAIPSFKCEAGLMGGDAVEGGAPPCEKRPRKQRKRKRRRRRKVPTPEEIIASRFVRRWVSPDLLIDGDGDGDEEEAAAPPKRAARVVFELHSHSTCSDGFLSPSALVERAHGNGVKVLALTDHDTMAGVMEALEAAREFGMKIIPGVEISAVYSRRMEEPEAEEPVHILAYYGGLGPSRAEELEGFLAKIRDGRYRRAKEILVKLSKLQMPLKLDHVSRIAGNGVAPGRLHVARAMVEAGYVENLKQAFNRYLYDGGPAYATGSEPDAEAVVQLVCRTGGIAALAHPWSLKNHIAIIKSLKAAGLQAIEVYRSDGKSSVFSDLADAYGLVKLGGSDYHGRSSGHEEPDLGSVDLPVLAVFEFLKLAQPIWCSAMREILLPFAEKMSDIGIEKIMKFGSLNDLQGNLLGLPSWQSIQEKEDPEIEVITTNLSRKLRVDRGYQVTAR